jgi:hypothetical protein
MVCLFSADSYPCLTNYSHEVLSPLLYCHYVSVATIAAIYLRAIVSAGPLIVSAVL